MGFRDTKQDLFQNSPVREVFISITSGEREISIFIIAGIFRTSVINGHLLFEGKIYEEWKYV